MVSIVVMQRSGLLPKNSATQTASLCLNKSAPKNNNAIQIAAHIVLYMLVVHQLVIVHHTVNVPPLFPTN